MVACWTPWGSLPCCWGALLLTALQYMTSLQAVASMPSTRVVYYLHTAAATWNEASSMCSRYGATLITLPDYQTTSKSITYVNANSWNGHFNLLTNGFWSGLYRNSSGEMRWQKCTDYDSNVTPPTVTPGGSAGSCYLSSTTYQMTPTSCNVRRPYICQRDDGQCWFQPYVDTLLSDPDTTKSHTNVTTAVDEGECGKLCRNTVEQNRECWGFTFKGNNCTLLFSDDHHKYAINISTNYFHTEPGQTAYVKICTGGWVTPLPVATADSSTTARDENCSVLSSNAWDDAICYCECDQPPVILEAESLVMTIDEKVEQIVKELQVNPSNTSSTRRKKESAEDTRPSAQSIGYFGVAFLTIVFGAICLMDLSVLCAHAAKLCKFFKDRNNKTDC